jgi:putative (di)nucleoside polyphosphate hydrolase
VIDPALTLPYRPCVGIMLINPAALIFIGRRTEGPEHIDALRAWQMPQGGIDEDEDPYRAALRELREETNISSIELLAASQRWLTYDLPEQLIGKAWNGRFRGQTQKWYALRFLGSDQEIDIVNPAGGHAAEFADWRWAKPDEVLDGVVPFKRPVYAQVLEEFAAHLAPPP